MSTLKNTRAVLGQLATGYTPPKEQQGGLYALKSNPLPYYQTPRRKLVRAVPWVCLPPSCRSQVMLVERGRRGSIAGVRFLYAFLSYAL